MARYHPNVLEYPDPNAPYGLRGVDLAQIPIRPEHITDAR
jgi:hypothetical protein